MAMNVSDKHDPNIPTVDLDPSRCSGVGYPEFNVHNDPYY
jgi:hypothetical protein